MFLHSGSCPRWGDDHERCICPRPWRIVRDRFPADANVWQVYHRDPMSEGYSLLVRCPTWNKALSIVGALERFDTMASASPTPLPPQGLSWFWSDFH